MMAYILASRSPRRREILSAHGITFKTVVRDTDETLSAGVSPADGVRILAERKAEAVADAVAPYDVVIAADTLVELDGRPLGKPTDADDARAMLRALSGSAHAVHTGVAVLDAGCHRLLSGTETTTVVFRRLSDAEIEDYIASGEPFDKAGAYGIQGGASRFVDRIEGELDCVIGLPATLLFSLLRRLGASPASRDAEEEGAR
jgi:septum formation protein